MKKFLKPALKFTLLFFVLLISRLTYGQVTPANCTQGCTSNDVQIKASYLSDAAGNKLSSSFVCPADGTADVYLTLELTTKTPRVGVAIFTRIKALTAGGPGAEVSGSPISQCFGTALNQPTNKVTFQQTFEWTCGTAIVMTDIFIGWGTGNTNFCGTNTSFICPATPSKCYQLPPDQFVAIETPVPQNNSASKCSDAAGGTTATFNLNNITVTNSSNVTITWWDDFTGPTTFSNQINSPSSYSTATNTVYAKITSNADNTVFTVSTVTLTVHQTPSLTITNPTAVCSPNTVDLTAAAVTAGSTLPAGTTLSYWTNSNGTGTVGTPGAVGAGTYYIKATTNTTPACSDIKAVTVTVNTTPGQPTVGVVNNCDGSSDLTASNYTGSLLWSNGATTASIHVTNAATYTVTQTVNGCTSSSGSGTSAPNTTPPTPSVCVIQPSLCGPATGKVSFTDLGAGYTYSIKNGAAGQWHTCPVFLNVAAGDVTGLKVKSPAGCVSAAANCNTICESDPVACAQDVVSRIALQQTAITEESQTKVKAYPNPFSDKVKFMVTSSIAGNGNLEVFNMMGQKVKTVYQGYIVKGTQTFELSLPNQSVGNLVYVLRIGDKKMTGKILQINR